MQIPDVLRRHYFPSQPTIRSEQAVSYREIAPDPLLHNAIYCYWELKTPHPLSTDFMYRVVADGCMDIFFDVRHPSENFVMGFSNASVEFPLGNHFHYIGIRFLPTMFPQCFSVDASELTNRFEHLNAVVPQLAQWIREEIDPEQDLYQIGIRLDQCILQIVASSRFDHDPRVYEAIGMILRNGGNVNIESGLDTGISPRQLRRLFKYYVGDTVKTFCKVVRFQNVLHSGVSSGKAPQDRAFLDHGYYDQAHFIKEFRHLYGMTPGKVK